MDYCSSSQDPLPGSAKTGEVFVFIEYTEAWGRAVNLDVDVPNPFYIRRFGRLGHVPLTQRHVYVAFLREAVVEHYVIRDIAELAAFDFGGPGRNVGAQLVEDPMLLVCTHAQRDRCCAIFGRPIMQALVQCFPDAPIWECSHTTGHRFAPSLLLLPWGYSYGRGDASDACALYDAARQGLMVLTHNRGRAIWSPREQVVELAVASYIGQVGWGEVLVEGCQAYYRGRTFQVELEQGSAEMVPSCGKPPKSSTYWSAVAVHELGNASGA